MQILAGVLLFFLSLTIGSLLCWHIYLLCHNMTTIEVSYYLEFPEFHPLYSRVSLLIVSAPLHQYREVVRAKWLAKKSGQKYRHRFDLGKLNNIQTVYYLTTSEFQFRVFNSGAGGLDQFTQ
jgi:palmitoyltransferase ZDHHC3/7/25